MRSCACSLLLFILGAQTARAAVDKTRDPKTSGYDVVFTVNEFLREKDIFDFDYGLLRRVAYVETLDGDHPKTYSTVNGGIWQVKLSWLQSTQSSSSLATEKNKIQSIVGIDWSTVTYEQLDIPLYSALAAGLYFSLSSTRYTIATQAVFWNNEYHSGAEDTAYFESQIQELESASTCAARALLYFVIDGSGSVGAGNFQTSLTFINHIIDGLDMGAEKTRVGMLHYSHRPTKLFGFDGNKASVKDKVTNCPYTRGGTKTGSAMDAALAEFAAESTVSGVARVMVVLTDGRSSDSVVAPAARAAAAGVTTVGVGIGSGIRNSELTQIANDKSENVLQAAGFNSVDNIIAMLQNTVCLTPGAVNLEEDTPITLRPDETTWLQTPAGPPGICVSVRLNSGVVAGYASFTTKHPNSAIYETLLGNNMNTYVATNVSAQTLYIAFQTGAESATLILNLNPLCPTFTATTTTTTHPFKSVKRFYADAQCRSSIGHVEQTIDNETGCITELRYKNGVWDNNTYYSRYHCANGKRYLVTYTRNTGCYYDPYTSDGMRYITYCLTNFLESWCDVAVEVTADWDKRKSAQCFSQNDPRGLEGWGTDAKSEQYDDPLPPALACGESFAPGAGGGDFYNGTKPILTDVASPTAVTMAYFVLGLAASFSFN